jgi:predicted DsbA family dithiol-disulfide isomerase
VEIGLDSNEVEHLLTTDAFSEEVHTDEAKAQLLGIRGVPFFVINDKYGVSGAQPQGIFLQALNMAWKEYAPQQIDTPFESENNVACPIDGQC